MPDTIHFSDTQASERPRSKPLDETVWCAWLQKNLLQERKRAATRIKAVNRACIGVSILAAVVSFFVSTDQIPIYPVVVRTLIALGATVMLLESIRTRQYFATALFVGIVLLFNPVLPALTLSGNWPIILASALPFGASLLRMSERTQAGPIATGL